MSPQKTKMLIGYARTSTTDQQAGFDVQLVELEAYGCERTFKEQVSAVASRGELDRAIDMLREADKLVVTKLDLLARNVMHMGELLQQIEARGAGLVIMSLGSETVDTTTATGKLILNMMVSVAQFEREMMKERQVEASRGRSLRGSTKDVFQQLCDRQTRLRHWLKLVCSVCRFRSSLG
jgi:DNA invertase Pin-like site-specific DNA recombinase